MFVFIKRKYDVMSSVNTTEGIEYLDLSRLQINSDQWKKPK